MKSFLLYLFALAALASARPRWEPSSKGGWEQSSYAPSEAGSYQPSYAPSEGGSYQPSYTGDGTPSYTGDAAAYAPSETPSSGEYGKKYGNKPSYSGSAGGGGSGSGYSGSAGGGSGGAGATATDCVAPEQTSYSSDASASGSYTSSGTSGYAAATSAAPSTCGGGDASATYQYGGSASVTGSPGSGSSQGTYGSGGGETGGAGESGGASETGGAGTTGGAGETGGAGNGDGSPTATGGAGGAASGTAGGAASGTGSAGPVSTGGTVSSGSITLPAGCASLNGIGIGWLPDSDNGVPLTTITSAMGNEKPCFAGYYAQITSSSWDGSQLTGKIKEVQAGGTPYPIFVASVMPSIPMSEVPGAAAAITTVMNTLTAAGLTVWLRFAHEMNWYDSAAGGYVYPQSSIADYQTAWAAVSKAVESNDNVKMFWSPNSASAASLKSAGWYPTGGAVDVIGVDIYPSGEESFSSVYESFCSGWDVPFSIGETGTGGSSADKTYWLQQLSSAAAKTACPNYVGFSYFEYDKQGTDFRVATGGNTEAESVLKT